MPSHAVRSLWRFCRAGSIEVEGRGPQRDYAGSQALWWPILVPNAEARVGEQSPADWRTFEVPEFGTTIQYPASIFTPAGQPEMGLCQRFERADGRAVLSIYARANKGGHMKSGS